MRFWCILALLGEVGTHSGPKWPTDTKRTPNTSQKQSNLEAIWGLFLPRSDVICWFIFLLPSGNPENQKSRSNASQNGAKKGGQIGRVGGSGGREFDTLFAVFEAHRPAQGRSRKEVKIGIGFGSPFGTLM